VPPDSAPQFSNDAKMFDLLRYLLRDCNAFLWCASRRPWQTSSSADGSSPEKAGIDVLERERARSSRSQCRGHPARLVPNGRIGYVEVHILWVAHAVRCRRGGTWRTQSRRSQERSAGAVQDLAEAVERPTTRVVPARPTNSRRGMKKGLNPKGASGA
jgi:hypothetical protein